MPGNSENEKKTKLHSLQYTCFLQEQKLPVWLVFQASHYLASLSRENKEILFEANDAASLIFETEYNCVGAFLRYKVLKHSFDFD